MANKQTATKPDETGKPEGESENKNTGIVPASVGTQLAGLQIGGRTYKAKQVTRTVLKQVEDTAIFVRFDGAIYQGEELKGQDKSGAPKMAPAHLANVQDLQSNTGKLIIVNNVLGSELTRLYPNNSYVGKEFSIIMRPSPTGKRYKTFEIFELEADESVAAE